MGVGGRNRKAAINKETRLIACVNLFQTWFAENPALVFGDHKTVRQAGCGRLEAVVWTTAFIYDNAEISSPAGLRVRLHFEGQPPYSLIRVARVCIAARPNRRRQLSVDAAGNRQAIGKRYLAGRQGVREKGSPPGPFQKREAPPAAARRSKRTHADRTQGERSSGELESEVAPPFSFTSIPYGGRRPKRRATSQT